LTGFFCFLTPRRRRRFDPRSTTYSSRRPLQMGRDHAFPLAPQRNAQFLLQRRQRYRVKTSSTSLFYRAAADFAPRSLGETLRFLRCNFNR
jgi:hypothetical protein